MLLDLKSAFPAKSTKNLLEFIQSERPGAVAQMKKQADYISRIVCDSDFEALKGETTRARRLADAVSGKTLFGWSWTYSVQRGQEFRRTKMRSEKE